MLSVGKLALGQQQYYVDAVARGQEETTRAPGSRLAVDGSGLSSAGLVGRAGRRGPGRVLEPCLLQRDRLTHRDRPRKSPAYDATFSRAEVGVAAACPEPPDPPRSPQGPRCCGIAGAAAGARGPTVPSPARPAGPTVIEGDGFVAAAFRHRTSRAGDPQLHTHVLVANLATLPPMGAGRRSTAAALRACGPSATSTRPSCATTSPAASALSGDRSATASPTSPVSRAGARRFSTRRARSKPNSMPHGHTAPGPPRSPPRHPASQGRRADRVAVVEPPALGSAEAERLTGGSPVPRA